MEKVKKDYLVEKYKNKLNDEDLKKFEEGLEQSSEHALSNVIDMDLKFISITKTVLYSVFLGAFGAGRFYLGNKKLGFLRLGITIGLNIIIAILLGVSSSLIKKQLYDAALIVSIISIVYSSLSSLVLLAWWIAELVLCIRRAKKLNRDMLLSAAFAQPGPDTEKTRSYHIDTYKTMCFHDKFKKEIPDIDMEKFKSAEYYVDDGAFESVESLKLKSKKTALLLSIFLGFFCAGSFYLNNYKRAILQIIINLVLTAGIVLVSLIGIPEITIILSTAIFIAILYRWGAEVDMCLYRLQVLNGKEILDTLKVYRDSQLNFA